MSGCLAWPSLEVPFSVSSFLLWRHVHPVLLVAHRKALPRIGLFALLWILRYIANITFGMSATLMVDSARQGGRRVSRTAEGKRGFRDLCC